MPEIPTDPMTVVRLTVDSFKRLRAANLTPSPRGLVPVLGKNTDGKSSTIESMLSAFGLERPLMPITQGEHGSDIVVELANPAGQVQLVVRQHWSRDSAGKAKSKLSVEGADGTPFASPAAVMKELVGFAADPGAFLDMKPEDQVKTVLSVLGFAEGLERLESDAKGLYDQRRDLGRDADRLSKAAAQMAMEVEGLPSPPGGESIEQLTAALMRAHDHNAAIAAQHQAQAAATSRGQEANARIVRLRDELAKLEQEVDVQRAAWSAAKNVLDGLGGPIAVEPIQQALNAQEEAHRHAGRRELMRRTMIEAEQANESHKAVELKLEAKRAEIAALLSRVPFPIAGMAYDPDEKQITLDGIPLPQASQGEKLRVAAAVSMAGAPKIRAIFVREGSLLDSSSQATLAEIALANGFQLWLELVDEPDPVTGARRAGIWIEDGEAREYK